MVSSHPKHAGVSSRPLRPLEDTAGGAGESDALRSRGVAVEGGQRGVVPLQAAEALDQGGVARRRLAFHPDDVRVHGPLETRGVSTCDVKPCVKLGIIDHEVTSRSVS